MIAPQTLAGIWPTAALLATAGLAVGVAYFGSLRRSVRLSIERHAWWCYLLTALTRIVAAALFFTLAVHRGAPALLAAFAGFLVARLLAVRAARRHA